MKHIFCIGLNYRGSKFELPDCELDAENLHTVITPKKGVLSKIYKSASPSDIDQILERCESFPKSDTIVFTFSGHGTTLPDSSGAIVLNNPKIANGIIAYRTSDIINRFAKMKASSILVLDNCYSASGSPDKHKSAKSASFICRSIIYSEINMLHQSNNSILPKRGASVPRTLALFASGESEPAYSTGYGGAFTNALIGARRKKMIGEKVVSIDQTVTKEVFQCFNIAKKTIQDQTPEYWGFNTKKLLFVF